jgi:uncharacterized protein (TIGR03067 family)
VNTGFLLIFMTLAFPAPKPDEPRTDLQKMQGTWRLVASSIGGSEVRFTKVRIEPAQTTISGTCLRVAQNEYRIEILDNGIMDLICVKGHLKGQRHFAIYSLEGNRLRICKVICEDLEKPTPRPTEFRTWDDSNLVLDSLERVPEKKQDKVEKSKQ